MADSNQDAKLGFIMAFFDAFERKIERLERIYGQGMQEEAITLACCYLGALAGFRYQSGKDKILFARFIIQYSPARRVLEKLCGARILERGKDPGNSQARGYSIQRFEEIREVLHQEASGVNSPNEEKNVEELLELLNKKLSGLDLENLRSVLQNFSIAAILYEDYRVPGVHRGGMARVHDVATGEPKFDRSDDNEQVYYEDGAVRFSIDFIINLMRECCSRLREDCEREVKWPHELL